MHAEGTMAQAINYSSIAPSSNTVALGHAKATSAFAGSGNRLVPKKGKASTATPPASTTPGTSTPVQSTGPSMAFSNKTTKRNNGPQPLRLPPGKLFFGYEVKPLRNKEGQAEAEAEQKQKQNFSGEGQTLRKKKGGDQK